MKFSEKWGALGAYFKDSEGTGKLVNGAYEGDIVQCKEEESHNPMDIFPNIFLADYTVMSEEGFSAENVTVTVTLNGDSFDYVVVNSDDD